MQHGKPKNGKILIEKWYREVKRFSRKEMMAIAQEEFDEEDFKRETGIKSFASNKTKFDAKRRAGRPIMQRFGFGIGLCGARLQDNNPINSNSKN
jgi:hypothetical protein